MKNLLACAAALGCLALTPAAAEDAAPIGSVSYFVVAHPDDWQLFMNPTVFHAMDEPGEKAVFVHVTAGDAGQGKTGVRTPYYKAREEGALRAMRFLANAHPLTGHGATMRTERVQTGGLTAARFEYQNAVAYFFRLPDGNVDGAGYDTTGRQSLRNLKSGVTPAMRPVTGGRALEGWQGLIDALVGVIERERGAAAALSVHYTEPDGALNPGDHSDHHHTGLAAAAAATRFPCAAQHRYDTYDTNNRPENVVGADLLIDIGAWGATASGLSDLDAHSTWDSIHNSWLGRHYERVTPGVGACPG